MVLTTRFALRQKRWSAEGIEHFATFRTAAAAAAAVSAAAAAITDAATVVVVSASCRFQVRMEGVKAWLVVKINAARRASSRSLNEGIARRRKTADLKP